MISTYSATAPGGTSGAYRSSHFCMTSQTCATIGSLASKWCLTEEPCGRTKQNKGGRYYFIMLYKITNFLCGNLLRKCNQFESVTIYKVVYYYIGGRNKKACYCSR